MIEPLFSVVVPCYNRKVFLLQALNSVWQQTYEAYEVIVVDDGSSDDTVDYLRSLGGKTKLLTQPHRGPGAARNRGVEHARGRYVAFLDCDDLWFPWTLETYAELAVKNDSPAFIAGKPFRFESVETIRELVPGTTRGLRFADYFASGDEWRWWGVSSFVVRTDFARAAGGFSETDMNGEDADLALKLGEAAGFVQVLSPFTFAYREHPANVMKNLSKTLAGARHLIDSERGGAYPGGTSRALERRRILTRHVRPVSLDCIAKGRIREGWEIYRSTLGWNARLWRWKYLFGFPVLAAARRLRSRTSLWQEAA